MLFRKSHVTCREYHWLQWDAPHLTPKTAPSLRRSPSHLTHPFFDRSCSTFQKASRSNQPFCHSTLFGQTERQTNRWHWQVCTNTHWRSINCIATQLLIMLGLWFCWFQRLITRRLFHTRTLQTTNRKSFLASQACCSDDCKCQNLTDSTEYRRLWRTDGRTDTGPSVRPSVHARHMNDLHLRHAIKKN